MSTQFLTVIAARFALRPRLFSLLLLLLLLLLAHRCAEAQDDPDAGEVIGTPDLATEVHSLQAAGDKKLDAGDPVGAQNDFKRAFELVRQRANKTPEEPSLAEDVHYFLGKLAQAYSAADDLASAVKMQQRSADGYGKLAAADATPENTVKQAAALGQLAWYQVMTGAGKAALLNARAAIELDPSQRWIKANLAHALLVSGAIEEARTIYLAERANELAEGVSFEQSVLVDFEKMEKAGIAKSEIEQIRALYRGPGSAAPEIKEKPRQLVRTSGWWLLPVLGILIAATVLVVLLSRGRAPQTNLEARARDLGFNFSPEPAELDHPLVAGTHLTTRGKERRLCNILEKETEGAHFTVFDISYVSDGGGRRKRTTQTVIRLESPRLCLPWFILRPRAVPIVALPPEVRCGEQARFQELYSVHGDDQPAIRQLFTPAIIAYCEEQDGLIIERRRDYLLAYWEGKRPRPEELGGFVKEGNKILSLFSHSPVSAV